MTGVVFPQEAVVEYVNRLLAISGDVMRDATMLSRQTAKLIEGGKHGRVLGILRKYAEEPQQSMGDEVRRIVDDMETFLDPKIEKQKRAIRANQAARMERDREKEEAEEKASWEPGGVSFKHAIGEMITDAHALIFMAKVIEDSNNEPAIQAMSDWIYSDERGRLFAALKEALKPPPEVSPSQARRCSRRSTNGKDDKVVRLFNDEGARP